MPKNSSIDHLREESRLWNKFAHQMRNVFLTFGSERLLVACSAAEGDHYNFSLLARGGGMSQYTWAQESAPHRQPGGSSQKFAPVAGELSGEFVR